MILVTNLAYISGLKGLRHRERVITMKGKGKG